MLKRVAKHIPTLIVNSAKWMQLNSFKTTFVTKQIHYYLKKTKNILLYKVRQKFFIYRTQQDLPNLSARIK